MSTELEPTEAVKQLLTCLEVLMEEVDFQRDCEEWFDLPDEKRHETPAPKRPTGDELDTAMWQVVDLTMGLLHDHLTLVQLFEDAADAADERERVGKIIRPKLVLPE